MNDGFHRDLLRGSLDLMVLSIIADGPTYGYDIQRRLKAASADRLSLQAGTLYPILHRLESDGLVVTNWDETTGRRRKFYRITRAGRQRLRSQARQWCRYAECMRTLLGSLATPQTT